MASRLITFSSGWPSSNFLIGSSCFLPESVRGMSSTWNISLGTNRGESAFLIASTMRAFRPASSTSPGRSTTNSGM